MIDEISLKKRHRYLTVIADWESGKVLGVKEERSYRALKAFFDSIPRQLRISIEAVAIDMWDPCIKAIKEGCPNAKIVFDRFHGVATFGRVIDKVRNIECRKATQSGKEVIKGTKYLLLKNKENITKEEIPGLKQLLELNENLAITCILKEYLKTLWNYRYPECATKAIFDWCSIAHHSGLKPLMDFPIPL